ncbi:choice-of-anchor R domain-containing protein [Papillibacter cinnamivorans]|uniref:Uncharacterized protein n=1 Tax=Papillibacter cinnamivorans DSM 12816 TaxID=1122930 RepID=A0A1W1YY70_9FIRM|nr:choice-of-anchor R domain-containing protein [Papillibacter cinnamivorans]SMC41022.1 hypothetical protein SAMN02745168_0765 [Papillibacter cinnamivorans DSM 12816]
MAITTITDDLNIIAALDDEPNDSGGLTAAALKSKFDEAGNALKTYVNGTLIPELDAVHLPYQYGVSGGQTIKEALDAATAGEIPDGSITALKLASDSVTTAKILDGNVTKAKLASILSSAIDNNTINILRLKLQQSLSHADIDAYSDLMADNSLLDFSSAASAGVSGGSVFAGIASGSVVGSIEFCNTTYGNVGQTFTAGVNTSVTSVSVVARGVGVDSGRTLSCAIYSTSGGLPNTLLYSAASSVSITNTGGTYTFTFSDANITKDAVYALVFTSNGGNDEYPNQMSTSSGTGYAFGNLIYTNAAKTVWSASTGDLWFTIHCANGDAIWSSVPTTEAITYAAVTADTTPGAGTITWYLSDDGTNWTEITAEDAVQDVSFDAAYLYLKCALTGNATVEAVAYGGY